MGLFLIRFPTAVMWVHFAFMFFEQYLCFLNFIVSRCHETSLTTYNFRSLEVFVCA